MTEEDAVLLRQTIIKEGVGLLLMAGILWYMGPGKIMVDGLLHRVRVMRAPRVSPIDAEVESFGRTVTRWDYEQAAKENRRPAAGGGCGCG